VISDDFYLVLNPLSTKSSTLLRLLNPRLCLRLHLRLPLIVLFFLPRWAHLANTTSVPTDIPATTLAPINTQRIPEVTPNLPPGYHALNPALNAPHPTPPQTPAGSPGGPQFPGHPIPGFIPTLPPQFFPPGNTNPSGLIPTLAPNVQVPVGGQGNTFPFPGHTTTIEQPTVGI
jgi:hypothetical protein